MLDLSVPNCLSAGAADSRLRLRLGFPLRPPLSHTPPAAFANRIRATSFQNSAVVYTVGTTSS
jgi:hypothetical protein